ncbi:membrane fusion protein, multidrug efflux system [Alkalispirochaeta americana]|uniref:Membrane fusion protein, multidrug efflux system n=1 Tax=Alkalispirochaeta americana TaxID=159291 RepID=A0A1N6SJL8_9SPIO|nr:efflux RND transporter periplasmic adaptor subunit [Alkalispirochaeta americana]SIQ41270.1 membrane fusion protein, multidrug efflux system [Alkalispirochaeta americana]
MPTHHHPLRPLLLTLALYLGLAMATLSLASCRPGPPRGSAPDPEQPPEQEPRPVLVVAVEEAPLVRTIRGSGMVSGIREASVVTETEGPLQRVFFDLGDQVRQGQILLSFDSERETAEVLQARADLDLARIELAAAESLQDRGTVSRAEAARRRAALSGAEARLTAAEKRYNDRQVRAPISGRIAARPIDLEEGTYLGRGVQAARIVDTSRLRTEIGLGEREIAHVRVGSEAQVRVPACSDLWRDARVSAVGAAADPRTGSFPLRVEWENPCPLRTRAGMSVQVRLVPQAAPDHLVVPTEAIIRRGDATFLFLLKDNSLDREDRAVLQEVEVVATLANRAALAGAIAPGDLVVVSALSALRHDDRVIAALQEGTP